MKQTIYENKRKIIYEFDSKYEMDTFLRTLKIIEVNKTKNEDIVIDEGQHNSSPAYQQKES